MDESVAKKVQKDFRCGCGGRLFRADFPRKVRGVDADTLEDTRVSYRCETCRKRLTPISARYLWRKVYALLAVAMNFETSGFIPSSARQTIQRWHKYWELVFNQHGPFMSLTRGLLQVEFEYSLPSLVKCLAGQCPSQFARFLNLLGCEGKMMTAFFRHRMPLDSDP